jgi:hypothetical protein
MPTRLPLLSAGRARAHPGPPPSHAFPSPSQICRANHDASDDIEGDNEGDYAFDRCVFFVFSFSFLRGRRPMAGRSARLSSAPARGPAGLNASATPTVTLARVSDRLWAGGRRWRGRCAAGETETLKDVRACSRRRADGRTPLTLLLSLSPNAHKHRSETSKIVLRVLTARSAQRVLAQLGDTDIFVQQWFNHFLADNPPLQGDAFVRALFKERAVYAKDRVTGTEHFVSPAQLAHRVLAMRELMARTVTQGFPEYVTRTNIEVLRAHLESSSYTSGTTPATSGGGSGSGGDKGRGRGGGAAR